MLTGSQVKEQHRSAEKRRSGRPGKLPGLLAIAVPLLVSLATMARGLVWGDGIELTTVSHTLGIAHPTGYPLFTLLAHPFCHLFPTPALGATFFCALVMALACGVLFRLLFELGRQATEVSPPALAWLALSGSLAFAWALAPWSHATRVEVYGLQLLLLLAMLSCSLDLERQPSSSHRHRVVLLFFLGLGHHLLAIVSTPLLLRALGVRASDEPPRALRSRGRWLRTAAVAALGLLPLLYLPIRAAFSPQLNFGDPSTLSRWLWVLKGGDFVTAYAVAPTEEGALHHGSSAIGHVTERLAELAAFLARQLVPASPRLGLVPACLAVGAILVILGLRRWGRHRFSHAAAWLISLFLYAGVLLTYDIGDISDYQLGFLALAWPLGWLGLVSSLSGAEKGLTRRVGVWLAVLPLVLVLANWEAQNRRSESLPDHYAARLLSALPPGAVLITEGDVATATAWYLQATAPQAEKLRVVCLNLLHHPWYAEQLAESGLWRGPPPERGAENLRLLETAVLPASTAGIPVYALLTRRSLRRVEQLRHVQLGSELLTEDERIGLLAAGDELPPHRLLLLDGP